MDETLFYDTLRQGLWIATVLSLPILLVALVTGLVIGLAQALTSVQEMTLTFVPKLAAIGAVFWISMGFMTETLVAYFQDTLAPLIAGGAEAMENPIYATLTRQTGLMAQLRLTANNVANASTTGYKAEDVIFSEYVRTTGTGASLSMATARVRETVMSQGTLEQTGGAFDLAIEGEGFFMVRTPDGDRLTRAGHFTPNQNGDLVTAEGFAVLDAGGAPVFVPQGTGAVAIAPDGTISAGGAPVGQMGVFVPRDPRGLVREGGTRFAAAGGVDPAPGARVVQGFLEGSNVNPVLEIARLIEVQRAYEMGQGFLDREDERIRGVIRAISK